MSYFVPDLPGIDGLLGDPAGPVGQKIEELGVGCETVAKRLAPVSHLRQDIPGLLRDSITHYIQMYDGAPGPTRDEAHSTAATALLRPVPSR